MPPRPACLARRRARGADHGQLALVEPQTAAVGALVHLDLVSEAVKMPHHDNAFAPRAGALLRMVDCDRFIALDAHQKVAG